MKQFTIVLIFSLLFLADSHAQIFVNSSATGANNGTSWANAFKSLEKALFESEAGLEVWVAKGVYKPDFSTSNNGFVLKSGVDLYGGFAGIETSIDQRNVLANETVLSGDIQGNDVLNDFVTNRSDNLIHILTCDYGFPSKSIIDGISFKNGHARTNFDDTFSFVKGGAILSEYGLTLRNCKFSQNHAKNGGCIYQLSSPQPTLIDQCIFENNKGFEQGAALYFEKTDLVAISNSIFKNNVAKSGGAIKLDSVNNCQIQNGIFEENIAQTTFGGTIYSANSTISISQSRFVSNEAYAGGAIYFYNNSYNKLLNIEYTKFETNKCLTGYGGAICCLPTPLIDLYNVDFLENASRAGGALYLSSRDTLSRGNTTIDSCYFYKNRSVENIDNIGGGALYATQVMFTISNSEFRENRANELTGAIFACDSTLFQISNTYFYKNSSAADGAYTLCNNSSGKLINCIMEANQASGNNSGAGSCLNSTNVDFRNCTFKKNKGRYGGGMMVYEKSNATVEDCLFESNTASQFGGGIFVINQSGLTVDRTIFRDNKASIDGGGLNVFDSNPVQVNNSVLIENYGAGHGGGFQNFNAEIHFVNCLIAKNYNSATGYGGGFSHYALPNDTSSIYLTNCTLADNVSSNGAGFVQSVDDSSNTFLYLKNCIIQQPGADNYLKLNGMPSIISLGGNQSSDTTLTAYLTHPQDANQTSAVFVDNQNDDYHLQNGPGVNEGVTDGAPLTDLDGNTRIGIPDRGCYEYGASSTHEPNAMTISLQLFPNPTTEMLNFTIDRTKSGSVAVAVVDILGRRLKVYQMENADTQVTGQIQAGDLESGLYFLEISTSEGKISKVFSKID